MIDNQTKYDKIIADYGQKKTRRMIHPLSMMKAGSSI